MDPGPVLGTGRPRHPGEQLPAQTIPYPGARPRSVHTSQYAGPYDTLRGAGSLYGTRAVHSSVANFVRTSSSARASSAAVTLPAVSP